jgi:hypothetical protein
MKENEMKTIRKNSIKQIKQIKQIAESTVEVAVFCLENYFKAELCNPESLYRVNKCDSLFEWIMKELQFSKRVRLTDAGNGYYTIHVHSNLWYTLKTNENFRTN